MVTSVPHRDQRAGVVLAGGASRRFGSDKAKARVPGSEQTFLEVAVSALRRVLETILIVAPSDRDYRIPGSELIPDLWPGEGPLGGVVSAHLALPEYQLLVIACDQIWLNGGALHILWEVLPCARLVCFRNPDGEVQPLPLRMAPSAGPDLERAFLAGERSLRRGLAGLSVQTVALPAGVRLDDVDRPDDLAGLRG